MSKKVEEVVMATLLFSNTSCPSHSAEACQIYAVVR